MQHLQSGLFTSFSDNVCAACMLLQKRASYATVRCYVAITVHLAAAVSAISHAALSIVALLCNLALPLLPFLAWIITGEAKSLSVLLSCAYSGISAFELLA